MKPESEAWLKKAEEDWLSASWLLEEDSPVVTPALFHLQQCAEKLLKACIAEQGSRFEKRHDLNYLLSIIQEPNLLPYADLLDELTPFAVEFRYPGDLPEISRNEAQRIRSQVHEFRKYALALIYSQDS